MVRLVMSWPPVFGATIMGTFSLAVPPMLMELQFILAWLTIPSPGSPLTVRVLYPVTWMTRVLVLRTLLKQPPGLGPLLVTTLIRLPALVPSPLTFLG